MAKHNKIIYPPQNHQGDLTASSPSPKKNMLHIEINTKNLNAANDLKF